MKLKRVGWAGIWLSLMLSACSSEPSSANSVRVKSAPNIVFIISDDHSSGHTGFSDPVNFDTPTLTKLAREGTVFTRAYVSVPQCAPSRASLMAGRSALSIRATRFTAPLSQKIVTFADVLRSKGYFTGMIGRTHHLDGSRAHGENADSVFDEKKLRVTNARFDVEHSAYGTKDQPVWISANVKDFLQSRPATRPFFLQFNFTDPHRPWELLPETPATRDVYLTPDMPERESVRKDFANYIGEVERMDKLIGALLKLLEKQNALDNTIVFFMGDNGAAILRGKGTLYEMGVRVPLIVWSKDDLVQVQRIDGLVSGEDIAPTFIDLAGAKTPQEMSGRSLVPVISGVSAETGRSSVFATRGTHGVGLPTTTNLFDLSRTIITNEHKFIYNVLWQLPYRPADAEGGEMWRDLEQANAAGDLSVEMAQRLFANPRPMFELYDLSKDPHEMRNLIRDPKYAQIKEQLRRQLERRMILEEDYVPLPFLPNWQAVYEKGLAERVLGYQTPRLD